MQPLQSFRNPFKTSGSLQSAAVISGHKITQLDPNGSIPIFWLPKEIHLLIFALLNDKSLARLQLTCRKFQSLTEDILAKRKHLYVNSPETLFLNSLVNNKYTSSTKQLNKDVCDFLIFKNTLYFTKKMGLVLENGHTVLTYRSCDNFENFWDSFILIRSQAGLFIYDDTFNLKSQLDFNEKEVTSPSKGKVFAILHSGSKKLTFFDAKNFKNLKTIESNFIIDNTLRVNDQFYVKMDNDLFVYHLPTFDLIAQIKNWNFLQPKPTSFEGKDYFVVKSSKNHNFHLFSVDDLESPLKTFEFDSRVQTFVIQRQFLCIFRAQHLEIWDMSFGKMVSKLDSGKDIPKTCFFENILFVANGKCIMVIHLITGKLIHELKNKENIKTLHRMEFSGEKLILFYKKEGQCFCKIYKFGGSLLQTISKIFSLK